MTDEAPQADGEHEAPEPAAPEAERRYGALVSYSRGQAVLHVERDGYLALAQALLDDGFNVCIDVTAVDYLLSPGRALPEGITAERFEVVANFLSHEKLERMRVRVQVPESDPAMPSLFDLHPGTENLEREVYDLMGIVFTGHPDLTRILMPDDWEGHPLRKDYAIGRIPVQFKATRVSR